VFDLATGHSLDVTLTGGANSGATIGFLVDSTAALSLASSAGSAVSGTFSVKVRGEFTSSREAKFDVRGSNAGQTATLTTQQVVDGTDANNMTVQLNEKNTSTVTVVSQNVQTNGQGLQLDFAQNSWSDRSDIDNAIKQLDAATSKLRGASSSLSTNLNVIQTREDYTAEFANVLTEGATKLTAADQNEEGANILTLQTRQQLGTISLSLANQAQQAILRLF
jgi:flagellin-like hook-associated protein FlgL